jgi:hypothetical protein
MLLSGFESVQIQCSFHTELVSIVLAQLNIFKCVPKIWNSVQKVQLFRIV